MSISSHSSSSIYSPPDIRYGYPYNSDYDQQLPINLSPYSQDKSNGGLQDRQSLLSHYNKDEVGSTIIRDNRDRIKQSEDLSLWEDEDHENKESFHNYDMKSLDNSPSDFLTSTSCAVSEESSPVISPPPSLSVNPLSIKSSSEGDRSFPSNPDKFGPGIWFIIHMMAINAKNPDQIDHFIEWINFIISELPCKKCRKHAISYMESNPLEYYYRDLNENGVPIGMFKWTWIFHNYVNNQLDKNIIDFDTAYNMY